MQVLTNDACPRFKCAGTTSSPNTKNLFYVDAKVVEKGETKSAKVLLATKALLAGEHSSLEGVKNWKKLEKSVSES